MKSISVLLGGVALALTSTAPVTPAPLALAAAGGATTAAVDSIRLMRDLSVLAHDSMAGRAVGTAGNAYARAYLVRRLAEVGAEAFDGAYEMPFRWGEEGTGVNVVGVLPGDGRTGTIVLTAHFDHVGVREGRIFNGADDNASGVAAALELARVIAAAPLHSRLVVALVDAEEVGLRGARAFVDAPPIPLDEIRLNVNLDMVARTGGTLWAGGAHHTPTLRPVLERVASTAPVELRLGHDRPGAPEGDDWTGASDHAPFHEAGIPYVYFGVEDHPDYHRPTDDVEAVDPGEFVASVRTILSAIRALDRSLQPDSMEPMPR